MKTDEPKKKKKKVLSKFAILCWAAFIATLGPGSDAPGIYTRAICIHNIFGGRDKVDLSSYFK